MSHLETKVIQLQSKKLTVQVLPDLGAVITSLVDRHGHEYLAEALHPRPIGLPLSANFNDGGLGGIDDCLPAVSGGVYPTVPFQGWQIPDHGEVWLRAWDVIDIRPEEATFSIQGLQLPYTFARRMLVEESILRLDYSLTNHSNYNLPIVWANHPMLYITPKARLEIDAVGWLLVEASNFGAQLGERLPYPHTYIQGKLVDFREISSLPNGMYLKAFAPCTNVLEATLHYPEWNTSLKIITNAMQRLHIGIWLNKRGFPIESPLEHISIEPTFGSSDSLERAYKDGNCLFLGAQSTETWTLRYQIMD